jgi:large subunit ribosomal protein L6
MSKIGRKPIDVKGSSVVVSGQLVEYKGPKSAGSHHLPESFIPLLEGDKLYLRLKNDEDKGAREINRSWGLEHALLANKIKGSVSLFEKKLKINGLGFKASFLTKDGIKDLEKKGEKVVLVGDEPSENRKGLLLELGYSHYYYFGFPETIDIEVDKVGQSVVIRSIDGSLAGTYASKIRALRAPEPYKGTGIKNELEVIRRKAGKKTG